MKKKSFNRDSFKKMICVVASALIFSENVFALPGNMIDATADYGFKYLCINNNITWDYTLDYSSQCVNWYVRDGYSKFTPDDWRGFTGFEINERNDANCHINWEPGKTYAIYVKIKNTSDNGIVPYFGAAINDTYDGSKAIYTNEYGKTGMPIVGSDWNEFKATITVPKGYNSKNTESADNLFFGMNKEMPKGTSFVIDCSQTDSVYVAEEVYSGVKLSCAPYSNLQDNTEISIDYEAVNQIGTAYSVQPMVTWLCLNSKDEIIDEAVIAEKKYGVTINIENVPKTERDDMKVIAICDSNSISRVIYPKTGISSRVLFVSPQGSDTANGQYSTPLKTLSGAKNKVREIIGNSNEDIEVIFKAGTYYFDNTVLFDSNDSGKNGTKVTYKASEKNSVHFSGAKQLNIASAEKITDASVISRLDENVRDKVVEFDLSDVFPYKISDDTMTATISQLYSNFDFPTVYLDSVEQEIAQWPSGDSNYAKFKNNGSGSNASKNSLVYLDDEPSKWTEEKNAWIGGYLSYDYSYARIPLNSVDSNNKLLDLNVIENVSGLYIVDPAITNTKTTKRWKAFNVLEEIKYPSQWYINPNTMKMYYYMPNDAKDKNLEVSVMKSALVKLSNTKNIEFENINFENTRGDGVTTCNVDSVNFKGCEFKNIGAFGISMYGSTYADTDKDYWQRQYINASYNCEISDCKFNNINGFGVLLDGGNVDTLSPSNNVLKNCIFYRCSNKIRAYETIMVKGCGNIVEHNNISNSTFQAIRHYGNNHIIRYNEIYDVIRDADDCGAIYGGRNTVQRGTKISYNYIHDIQGTFDAMFGHKPAIYWDDNQTGLTADHNIIKNAKINVYTNGVDSNFSNNTSIDITKTNLDFKNGGAASNNNSETTAFSGYIKDIDLYTSTYPNLAKIINSSNRKDRSLALLTTIKNNVCINGPGENGIENYTMYSEDPSEFLIWSDPGELNPNVSGNIDSRRGYDDFVNPSKQDYRVKSTSSLMGMGLVDEDFDIEQIGVVTDTKIDNEKFLLVSPENGTSLNANNVHFTWSESFGANKYTLVVATDKEFSNIVKTYDTYFAYCDLDLANDGTIYYWKVIAENISREFASKWESESGYFTNGECVKLSCVKDSGNIYVSATNNKFTSGANFNLFAAMFDDSNKLIKVYSYKKENFVYNDTTTICGFEPHNWENATKMKVFVWDEWQKPLGNVLDIDL